MKAGDNIRVRAIRASDRQWLTGKIIFASSNGLSLAVAVGAALGEGGFFYFHPEMSIVLLLTFIAAERQWIDLATGAACEVEQEGAAWTTSKSS
jgi:hypothetical protein